MNIIADFNNLVCLLEKEQANRYAQECLGYLKNGEVSFDPNTPLETKHLYDVYKSTTIRMKIDQTTVRKMAHLARLDLEPQAEAAMLDSMSEILDWVAQLDEVDTTGVEPLTNMSFEVNALREDRVGEHLSREQGLRNAPRHDGEFFRVPKVLE